MNNNLGPVQQKVLEAAKEYYKLYHKIITPCVIVDFTGMRHNSVKNALDMLSQKGKLRRLRNGLFYGLLC
jgi:predicted transcriptional regulator of viral defense system